jgi:hypothetical protein
MPRKEQRGMSGAVKTSLTTQNVNDFSITMPSPTTSPTPTPLTITLTITST